ncbi:hypothetical protein CH063_02564 [Colletotrichum higginsianum]|uniref:Uncharacterized protein n=1 Tax=Colletotrichum higginsianum (strain IMI 349063) TaxID=759273 RepID=H1VM29_COLHI|nr:hypothetical protein CH063_02564 [Colletotrichum higginsianum]
MLQFFFLSPLPHSLPLAAATGGPAGIVIFFTFISCGWLRHSVTNDIGSRQDVWLSLVHRILTASTMSQVNLLLVAAASCATGLLGLVCSSAHAHLPQLEALHLNPASLGFSTVQWLPRCLS